MCPLRNFCLSIAQASLQGTETDAEVLSSAENVPPKVAARQDKKQSKRAATLKNNLEGLRLALTSAINEQIQLRDQMVGTDALAQHEQDWQHSRVPRAWAIQQAGYSKLFRKVQNYKRDGGHQGSASTNIQLLATDLGWTDPNVLHGRCDPQKVYLQSTKPVSFNIAPAMSAKAPLSCRFLPAFSSTFMC